MKKALLLSIFFVALWSFSYGQTEKFNVLVTTGNSREFANEQKILKEFYSDIEIQLEWESPNFKLVTKECLDWDKAEELRKRFAINFPDSRVVKCIE